MKVHSSLELKTKNSCSTKSYSILTSQLPTEQVQHAFNMTDFDYNEVGGMEAEYLPRYRCVTKPDDQNPTLYMVEERTDSTSHPLTPYMCVSHEPIPTNTHIPIHTHPQ